MYKSILIGSLDEGNRNLRSDVKNEKGKSEKLRRAVILKKADMDGPGWKDEKISEGLWAVTFGLRRTSDGSSFWKASRPPWCAKNG